MPTGVYVRTKPNSQKQRDAARQAGRKNGAKNIKKANETGKNRGNGFDKKPLMGKDLVEHHNDFCHGAERPDDITIMTNSEHTRLHAKLQYQDRGRDSKGRFI